MLVNIHTRIVLLLFSLMSINAVQGQIWPLQKCIDTAWTGNKNLQINNNNIKIGEEKEKEAKGNLIPKITTNADYKYFTDLPYQLMPLSVFGGPEGKFKEAQFGVPHSINGNIQLSMPLYSPQVYGAIQSAEIVSELTALQYRKTEEQIYVEISTLYYNAQIIYHQLGFVKSNLLNTERLLKNMQLLHEQLLAKGTDVSKLKLQEMQLTLQKENLNNKYIQILNALKFAMGVSLQKDIQPDTVIQYENTIDYKTVPSTEVQITNTQNRLLSNELKILNYSRFLPSFQLIGSYGTTGFGYDKKPNDFLKFYPIGYGGIQMTYPLFNGTVTQRKMHQKKIELLNNELQAGLLSEQINMQVENARLQRTSALKMIDPANEQIKLAQTIFEQTLLQQKQGTAALTDVLLADNALRDAQQGRLTAIIDYLKADLELKKLTGNTITHK